MKVYLIAGENSGDFIGSKIISSLKNYDKDAEILGVGGPLMEAEKLKSLFDISQINIMGFFEVIPHIFNIYKLINETVEDILRHKPQILVTIDSPGFTYRVAQKVRKLAPEIKLVHVVAPSVWAYRPGRAKKYADLYDHLLTLFPFEVPFFTKLNLPSTAIGHPIFQQNFAKKTAQTRAHFTNNKDSKIISITPGSRLVEIRRHMPEIVKALEKLSLKYQLTVIFVQPNDKFKAEIEKFLYKAKFAVRYSTDRLKAFAASDCALAKSGTNTLEIAASGVPMIVGYKVNILSSWLMRMLIKVPYISLINIIANKQIIPELIQNDFNSHNIAHHLDKLLSQTEYAKTQIQANQKIVNSIGFQDKNSPSDLAAEVIMNLANAD